MSKDLEGKVMLVTGATEGIGKAAAIALAKRGAALTLVGRSRDKSERVVAEIKAASGHDQIDLLIGDLSKIADARATADAFAAGHDRLDVLVNNAGAVFQTYGLSADGFEMTFALNHLAYFVMTTQLLELLKKTEGARVVSTSSGAHRAGKLDLATVAKRQNDERAGFAAYGDSKLANILFTRELARRLAGTSVTANCFHPGFVATGFGRNEPGVVKWFLSNVGPYLARTPEKGAETLIWLAASPEATRYTGQYFQDMKLGKLKTARAQDDTLAKDLWTLSEQLTA
jgi:NAD(P)-dependent dehydrogenase (short-subunit alcohol dehydrogenase family)